MTKNDICKRLMDEAVASEYGITASFDAWEDAHLTRHRFYRLRDGIRIDGNNKYDCLSARVKPNTATGKWELHLRKFGVPPTVTALPNSTQGAGTSGV